MIATRQFSAKELIVIDEAEGTTEQEEKEWPIPGEGEGEITAEGYDKSRTARDRRPIGAQWMYILSMKLL